MPFTPFHFGPGLLFKSIARKFSFTIFIFSQIIIDVEPLYFILTDNPPLHRLLHSFLGANIVVLISVLIGKPICELGLGILDKIETRFHPSGSGEVRPTRMSESQVRGRRISWTSAIWTAVIGAYSHVFLDCLMHGDLQPFAPFSSANPFLHSISVSALHLCCLIAFGIGSLLCLLRQNSR